MNNVLFSNIKKPDQKYLIKNLVKMPEVGLGDKIQYSLWKSDNDNWGMQVRCYKDGKFGKDYFYKAAWKNYRFSLYPTDSTPDQEKIEGDNYNIVRNLMLKHFPNIISQN
jgi:hypothetical protein